MSKDDDVGTASLPQLDGLAAVAAPVDLVSRLGQIGLEHLCHGHVVLDDQNPRCHDHQPRQARWGLPHQYSPWHMA